MWPWNDRRLPDLWFAFAIISYKYIGFLKTGSSAVGMSNLSTVARVVVDVSIIVNGLFNMTLLPLRYVKYYVKPICLKKFTWYVIYSKRWLVLIWNAKKYFAYISTETQASIYIYIRLQVHSASPESGASGIYVF